MFDVSKKFSFKILTLDPKTGLVNNGDESLFLTDHRLTVFTLGASPSENTPTDCMRCWTRLPLPLGRSSERLFLSSDLDTSLTAASLNKNEITFKL